MRQILLCEPNISEGRDHSLLDALSAAIAGTGGARLIDRSSDPSHNRSVFSYLGDPRAVLEATESMAQIALEGINMASHTGEHPRMGAVDVVPFIPVRNVSVEEAVAVSREFGSFLGDLGVPVYYYEKSALKADRTSLPAIRRGEYEGLTAKLKDPAWAPDEGPRKFNAKSGATVTGVRPPLIAFNVNLATNDLATAKEIASAVREKNGGLPAVRAIGLSLQGGKTVQVSMNLVDCGVTSIARAFKAVNAEAARRGIEVASSELIGPVPLEAMTDAFKDLVKVKEFSVQQIIEVSLINNG
jgi:glutamate formiminotransferase